MRVIACIPCYGDPKLKFVESLLALQKRALLAGFDFRTEIVSRTLIDLAREDAASRAARLAADYLLWLDVDMTFPEDVLERLLAHDLPVVGANCRLREDGSPSASMRATMNGRPGFIPIAPRADGLQEVDVIGLAVCLMKAEVLHKLDRPWFARVKQGEDGFFFQRLFELKGIRPVVDHSLSKQVGHIAETVLMW